MIRLFVRKFTGTEWKLVNERTVCQYKIDYEHKNISTRMNIQASSSEFRYEEIEIKEFDNGNIHVYVDVKDF